MKKTQIVQKAILGILYAHDAHYGVTFDPFGDGDPLEFMLKCSNVSEMANVLKRCFTKDSARRYGGRREERIWRSLDAFLYSVGYETELLCDTLLLVRPRSDDGVEVPF